MEEGILVSILVRDSSLGAISVTSQALRVRGVGASEAEAYDVDMGFGLQTARRCMERLGGSLSISSSPVVGSQYLIRAPVLEFSPVGGSNGSRRKKKLPNVLLVEDTKLNAMVARTLMERLGWTVTHVNNGSDAIQAFPLKDYSLVLMDIQMPLMGGVESAAELAKIAAASGSDAEIVAFTANASDEDVALYQSVGMKHVLRKPITIDSLRELLSTLDLVF